MICYIYSLLFLPFANTLLIDFRPPFGYCLVCESTKSTETEVNL